MATQAKGNVQLPAGTVSGVGGPQGVPASGTLNFGAMLLNLIGPAVNGGVHVTPASPLAAKTTKGQNLPGTTPIHHVALLGLLGLVALIKWG